MSTTIPAADAYVRIMSAAKAGGTESVLAALDDMIEESCFELGAADDAFAALLFLGFIQSGIEPLDVYGKAEAYVADFDEFLAKPLTTNLLTFGAVVAKRLTWCIPEEFTGHQQGFSSTVTEMDNAYLTRLAQWMLSQVLSESEFHRSSCICDDKIGEMMRRMSLWSSSMVLVLGVRGDRLLLANVYDKIESGLRAAWDNVAIVVIRNNIRDTRWVEKAKEGIRIMDELKAAGFYPVDKAPYIGDSEPYCEGPLGAGGDVVLVLEVPFKTPEKLDRIKAIAKDHTIKTFYK